MGFDSGYVSTTVINSKFHHSSQVLPTFGLRSVRPYFQARLTIDFDLAIFHICDGWSPDSPPGVLSLDYYSSSFAIHFAWLVYFKRMAKEDYRARVGKFAVQFVNRLAAGILALPSKPSGMGAGRRRLGMDRAVNEQTEFKLRAERA
jgi:hypothetical protein